MVFPITESLVRFQTPYILLSTIPAIFSWRGMAGL